MKGDRQPFSQTVPTIRADSVSFQQKNVFLLPAVSGTADVIAAASVHSCCTINCSSVCCGTLGSGVTLWEGYDLSFIVLRYVEVALRVARRHRGGRKTVCKEK
jgi:hypothetical protein